MYEKVYIERVKTIHFKEGEKDFIKEVSHCHGAYIALSLIINITVSIPVPPLSS